MVFFLCDPILLAHCLCVDRSGALILEFVAGMVAAYLFGKMSPTRWWVPLCMGLLGVVVFALLHDPHRAVLGIALAPMVLA